MVVNFKMTYFLLSYSIPIISGLALCLGLSPIASILVPSSEAF